MKHPFFAAARPLVFAHRGGAGLAPENTLAAFNHGLALGADGLEFDVRLSRDGVVVVHHDQVLDRTTNLKGPVNERTAAELARADAGWHFQPENGFPFRGRGIGVPTVSEVLARCRDVRLIVELKDGSPGLARATLEAIRAADAMERVCVASFHLGGLEEIRRLEPRIATSAARPEVKRAVWRSLLWLPFRDVAYAGFQVPEYSGLWSVASSRLVRQAHQAGLGVQVWTVNTVDQARRLLRRGADALITDRPDVIVPFCKKFTPEKSA